MFVRSWMSRPAITVSPDTSIRDAARLMKAKGIRRLPVVRDGELVGIVTKSDLHAAVGISRRPDAAHRRSRNIRVGKIMTRRPLTVEKDETLEQAADLMLRRRISGLPVMDRGRLAGIITESDIFRAFCVILGFRRPSARLALSIPANGDLLEAIERAAGKYSILSLISYFDPTDRRWETVIRLRGRRAARPRPAGL